MTRFEELLLVLPLIEHVLHDPRTRIEVEQCDQVVKIYLTLDRS